jgi:UDP-N-acetylglucosamine--N-acetylmuramyl-(pentapeptide) pyrophosphoryl-undecaprenol N-acetylglucosamine transferase
MTPPLRLCVSCGGTGGHMFPGLATAQTLLGRGHEVTVLIGGKRIEASTRQAWTGPVVVVPAEGLSAHPLRLPRSLLVLARVYRQCVREFRRLQPDALLAMGSYSSVGPVLAARRLRIPVVLHEANVIPGRAIEFLSRFAAAVAISFDETRAHLRHPRLELTGIPLRRELAAAAQTTGDPPVFTVLVMGGSQGAQRLNQAIPAAITRLAAAGLAARVIHLAGERDRAAVEAAYRAHGIAAVVHGFLADMASAYRQTSVAVCRSGAASCAELALFGLPAILVPYPEAARDHQRANALALQSTGAAVLVDQSELTPERLGDLLQALAADPARRQVMRQASLARALPGADRNLADLVERAAASR